MKWNEKFQKSLSFDDNAILGWNSRMEERTRLCACVISEDSVFRSRTNNTIQQRLLSIDPTTDVHFRCLQRTILNRLTYWYQSLCGRNCVKEQLFCSTGLHLFGLIQDGPCTVFALNVDLYTGRLGVCSADYHYSHNDYQCHKRTSI